jgi:hypothetical protein
MGERRRKPGNVPDSDRGEEEVRIGHRFLELARADGDCAVTGDLPCTSAGDPDAVAPGSLNPPRQLLRPAREDDLPTRLEEERAEIAAADLARTDDQSAYDVTSARGASTGA